MGPNAVARRPPWARRTGVILHLTEAMAWSVWGFGGAGVALGMLFALCLVSLAVAVARDRAHVLSLANAGATAIGGARLLNGPAPGAVVATIVASFAILVTLGVPWGTNPSRVRRGRHSDVDRNRLS